MSVERHTNNIFGAALSAATEIHIAMCLFADDHAAQANLSKAMHSVLIVAEECRQSELERRGMKP